MEKANVSIPMELRTKKEMERKCGLAMSKDWKYYLVRKDDVIIDCGNRWREFELIYQPFVKYAIEKLEKASKCPFKAGDWARDERDRLVKIISQPMYDDNEWVASVKKQGRRNDVVGHVAMLNHIENYHPGDVLEDDFGNIIEITHVDEHYTCRLLKRATEIKMSLESIRDNFKPCFKPESGLKETSIEERVSELEAQISDIKLKSIPSPKWR